MAEFFDELYKQIYVTFIYESRWRFFVDGFWMTLLLTFSSFILGTLIGILFCKLKMSGGSLGSLGNESIYIVSDPDPHAGTSDAARLYCFRFDLASRCHIGHYRADS